MRHHVVLSVLLALGVSCGGPPSQPAATAPTATAAAPGTTVPSGTAAVTPSTAPTAATALVEMGDHYFDPAQLTVKVGTTVTWKVVGQSTHDIAARDGAFRDGAMTFGRTLSHTFTRAGRYAYVCMQHEGDGMVGVVIVVD